MSHQLNHRLLKDINKHYKTLSKEEEIEVIKLAKQGHAPSRDKLVNSQLRSILVVADYYANHKTLKDDLVMEGVRGVIKAIEHFDLTRDIRFVTYSRPWIKHYISQFTMQDDAIRHPTNINARIKAMKEALPPNEEPEVNLRIGMLSLDAPINTGRGKGDNTLGETLACDEDNSPAVKFENMDMVKKLLSHLNKRQLIIFQLHYGLPQIDPATGNGWIDPNTGKPRVDELTGLPMQEDPLSMQVIGDRLELTKASISLIIINCKKLLRRRYGDKVADLSKEAIEASREDGLETEDDESFQTIGMGKINMKFQSRSNVG